MTDVTFDVAAAFDRALFWGGGDSVRYLVARLCARAEDDVRPAERGPLNIALVIDASGSMAGGKLEAAKKAALGLAERLTARDRLTLVSFASDVQVHLDGVPMTADALETVRLQVTGLETRGSTNLSGGWFAGIECAARLAEEAPRMTPRVIILSDGHANEGITDAEALRQHAGELRLRGVLTSALGIGDGYDEQLLRGIAENGGGRLHDAELTSEIDSVLLGELDDIFGTVVEDAMVAVTLPEGVRVAVLGRDNLKPRNGRLELPIGPIQNGVERVAVFRVRCPEAQPGDALAFELVATGRTAAAGAVLEAGPVSARLTAAAGRSNSAQERDTDLAAIVARVWRADIVSTAARMNRAGEFESATRYIDYELHHFRKFVDRLEGGPMMIHELELLARNVGRHLSSRMHKEMVLESALMMERRIDRRGAGKESWSAKMAREG